jgi:DNA-binding XRE family transcriptional regulator
MTISEATKIRVIRALTGMKTHEFATKLGVTPQTVTGWERGRFMPQKEFRIKLGEVCDKLGIGFMPSGMPCPVSDLYQAQENSL